MVTSYVDDIDIILMITSRVLV